MTEQENRLTLNAHAGVGRAEDLNGLEPGAGDNARLVYGVQNLIVAAGNLSKTLWGTGPNETVRMRRYAERRLFVTVFPWMTRRHCDG